jgi:hypothetical protein
MFYIVNLILFFSFFNLIYKTIDERYTKNVFAILMWLNVNVTHSNNQHNYYCTIKNIIITIREKNIIICSFNMQTNISP